MSLTAWAILGAGCDAQTSNPRDAAAAGGAPPAVAAPPGPLQVGGGVSDPDARLFYQRRGGKSAWTPAQAKALTNSFADARRHGLNPAAFAVKRTSGDDPDQQDLALTLAAFRYARALAFGFVDPRRIEKVFTLEPNRIDLAAGLEQALAKADVPRWLTSLPPSDSEYQALSAAYLAAADVAAFIKDPVARCQTPAEPSAPVPATPAQSPPPEAAPSQSPSPPAQPEQSVSPAQSAPAQGAAPSQEATVQSPIPNAAPEQAASAPAPPTTAGLSRGYRARQLAANLERRRWLNRSPAATRIDVNTASCTVVYLRSGTDPWAARMVCGKIGHETPSIQGSFHRLVANPPWRVPMDIARREIFTKGRGYMRREQMHVVNGRVVQRPGPHNSLGSVKFDVDDPYEIYLHDTPSKSLFALPERHKSHGCVRVQNAVGLARLIAQQNGRLDAFNKALASGKTGSVDIGEAIPVRLLYHTAFADEAGQITFAPDTYGWNDKLATALGLGPAQAAAHRDEPDVDVGP